MIHEKTWEELGMKPGIRVPGTRGWMAKWHEHPNQKSMIEYAQKVNELAKTLTGANVNRLINQYLSGEWDPKDEVRIAAAIRRSPVWEEKVNLMEEHFMSKKDGKDPVVKKTEAEGTSLKARIEKLEEEMKAMKKAFAKIIYTKAEETIDAEEKKGKKKKKDRVEASEDTGDTAALLKQLEKAKKGGDKKEAFKIRVKLRKAGYSLRANGKK